MKEFWNSEITLSSWLGLQDLNREIDFMLIGGWAAYLYTKLQKSKGIDIIVDYRTLGLLKGRYALAKNERLKKYEIKLEKYDIDIYLPGYSVLAIPAKDIVARFGDRIAGFTVPAPEALMILKLGAASDRLASMKGVKDSVDILGLLFYSNLDILKLRRMLSEYGLMRFMDLLLAIINGFDRRNLGYLNLNENSFAKLKRRYRDEIKRAL